MLCGPTYDFGKLLPVFVLVHGPVKYGLPLHVLYCLVQLLLYSGLDPSLVQPWYLFKGVSRDHRAFDFHCYGLVIVNDGVGIEVFQYK